MEVRRGTGMLSGFEVDMHGGTRDDGLDTMECFFFSSRRRHTRLQGDWSSDVCSSDLVGDLPRIGELRSDFLIPIEFGDRGLIADRNQQLFLALFTFFRRIQDSHAGSRLDRKSVV